MPVVQTEGSFGRLWFLRRPFCYNVVVTFSIIIPVYNAAPYLRACLDSLLVQTCADWEAICVDDGSTDGSGAILDEYSAKDSRFRVIHQANVGEGGARNAGLDVAGGEWIVFVDADDVIERHALGVHAEQIRACPDAELSTISALKFEDGDEPSWRMRTNGDCRIVDVSVNTTEDVFELSLWVGAYRATSMANLRFESLPVGADKVFVAVFLCRIKTIVQSDYIGYGYRLRTDSAFHARRTAEKFLSRMKHYLLRAQTIGNSCKRYETRLRRDLGRDLTETLAFDYARLPRTDRKTVWPEWTAALRTVSRSSWATRGIRGIARIVGVTESPCLMWVLCWFVGWLRHHGFNRRLRIVPRDD